MSEFDEFGTPPGHTGQSPKTRKTPVEVAEDRIDALKDTPLDSTGKPPSPEAVEEAKRVVAAKLSRASDLLPADYEEEPAELGFEPDNKYLSFPILPKAQWPKESRHRVFKHRFYIVSPKGTVGLVPWPGSVIVWPWEAAWNVDLHRDIVTSYLKEEKPKAKRK